MLSLLSKRIRYLRELKNWTQAVLAEKAGVSRSYISELERSTREPTVGILKSIADAFQVPIDIFFDDTMFLPLAELADMLPEDILDFLNDQEGLPYIKLAKQAKEWQILPEVLADLIEALRKAQGGADKWEFCREVYIILSQGIAALYRKLNKEVVFQY